jgi:hypothetical protein
MYRKRAGGVIDGVQILLEDNSLPKDTFVVNGFRRPGAYAGARCRHQNECCLDNITMKHR